MRKTRKKERSKFLRFFKIKIKTVYPIKCCLFKINFKQIYKKYQTVEFLNHGGQSNLSRDSSKITKKEKKNVIDIKYINLKEN